MLFLIFISDLPKFINDQSIPILFADDTNILVSHPNILVFYKTINTVFQTLNDWFKHNFFSLNLTKTHFINFLSKKNNQLVADIEYNNKSVCAVTYTRLLGLTVNCLFTWIDHIDLLAKKLSSTCYLVRNVKLFLSISALKMIYHSILHFIMYYGIILWENSPQSPVNFKMQKRVIRVITGTGYREFCRGIFKELKILTLSSQYILSLLLFVVHTLTLIAPIITSTPDKKMICTCLMYP